MELVKTASENGNTAFAVDEIVIEIIDGILSEMVSKIVIKDSDEDGTFEMQKHDIDKNIFRIQAESGWEACRHWPWAHAVRPGAQFWFRRCRRRQNTGRLPTRAAVRRVRCDATRA